MFENSAEDIPPRVSKREQTKARIRDAAIASFTQHGYADTTMRAIAADAGVAVGNAYYHYPSKTHLVQELYIRVQQEHAALVKRRLGNSTNLIKRLRIVFESGLEVLTPYRRIAPGFLTAMIPPDSPLNPLGEESGPARESTIAVFREALEGAKHRLPEDIAAALPQALFVIYLALVLRWTYDTTNEQRSTARLLDAGLRLFSLALPVLRFPGVHGTAREMLDLIGEVRP